MSSYYNPSKRLSEYAAALLSPYIKLENEVEDGSSDSVPPNTKQQNQNHTRTTPSSLSVGLWSGNVELNNVELRPEAFEQFLNQSSSDYVDNNDDTIQIRWKVIHGSIDSVKIQIPWTSLLVGSAHSSSKCSKSGKGDSDGVTEGKTCPKDSSNNQEVDGEEEEGCTTVQIKGVKLQLGYDVINNQHQQNMQKNEPVGCEQQVENYIIQDKIREEKNRILQTAEKRLLAGLDPFPPKLMEGLQSIMTSSMQSALLHPKNDDSGSVNTSNTQDSTSAIKSYRSKMENYLSSTIKSLLWKVFDSLSLSVTEVQVSVAGYSHYDKDFASILRKRRKEMEGKSPEKKQQQKVKQEQQQSNSRHKKNVRRRDHRNITAARSRHLLYRHSSSFHRMSTDSSIENYKEVEENVRQQSDRGSINEDSSIWSREGQVELGITIDRFDFKPGPLSTIDDNDDAKVQTTDSIALKLIQFKGLGVFLRRKCPMISRDGGAWDEYCDVSSAGGHTGKTLIWNDRKDDDYIVLPTYIEGSCKVYRNISGSATTDSTLSKQKMETDVHSTGIVSNSKDTVTTRRRGKREKRRVPSSDTKDVDPVVQTATKQHNNLSNTTPSTATLTTDKGTCRFGDNNTFTPPHRFELSLEMGHVRSSVSPRQLFLMHSVASSIEREKRGRPPTTIRDAQSYDKKEHERMIEEGTSVKQSVIDWEERIYREIPALRSKCIRRGPMKTLPGVVSSWWRYACLNIVNEIQDRKALLSKCSGDTQKCGRKGNILSRIDAQRAWDWEKQSSIRREYIGLYLLSRQSLEEGQALTTIHAAAVTAATFRLEQMEDELRPERILLLKHVARAASIRLENGETSPADRHYTFKTTDRRQTMDSSGDGNTLRMSSQEFEGSSSPSAIQPTTAVATRKLDEGRPIQKKKSLSSGSIQKDSNRNALSFSTQLVLSGFSLAVCDFSCTEVTSDSEFEVEQYYRADDVSVLTGYSDEDEYKPLKQELGVEEYFDPSCRFWSTMRHGIRCEVPLLLLHIVDISIAVKDMNKKFSIGGICLQSSLGLGQQNRFCLGHIPSITNDSIDGAASTKDSVDESNTGDVANDVPNQPIGISGCLNNGCSAVKVGATEIIVDWDWLEQLFKFASANKDIQPSKSTVPLQSEDLLIKTMSENSSQTIISTTLECDRLSLTIPVQRSKNGNKFLVTTINHMNIKAGNFFGNTPIDLESNIVLLPSQDLLIECRELDPVIMMEDNNNNINMGTITRLLRCPINVQLQYSAGVEEHSSVAQQPRCRSFELQASVVDILVSEIRLKTLVEMINTVSTAFVVNASDNPGSNELPKPFIPTLAEYVLIEAKLSIQSLSVHIIQDESEKHSADNNLSIVRQKLKDNITSYISQLSCLDFDYPNENTTACISRLIMERCCALGISEGDAKQCLDTAKSYYRKEASIVFPSSSRGRSRRIKDQSGIIDPEGLSTALDQIVDNVTRKTVSEFDHILLQLDSTNSNQHDLSIDIGSLMISKSFLYYRSTMQINARSITISNDEMRLLSIQPHSAAVRQTSPPEEKKESNEADDTALEISLHDRSAVKDHQGSCQEIYIEAGCVTSTFSPEAYLEAMKLCKAFMPSYSGVKSSSTKKAESTISPKRQVKDTIVNGNISSFVIVLTDKNLPFIECKFADVDFSTKSQAKVELQAGNICIDCVYQSTYPNIISTYPSTPTIGEVFDNRSAFSFQYVTAPDCGASEVVIGLDGVRVVLLRQILNEIMQYTLSPKYGIGLFLHCLESEQEASPTTSDINQDPLNFQVSINNSSVILPRNSNSIDMVGIEVDEISLTREHVAKTWSTDNYSFSDNSNTAKSSQRRSTSEEDSFYDCVDDAANVATTPRFSVLLRRAHIFTSLNKRHHTLEQVYMPEFNANVHHTGRLEHNKPSFLPFGKDKHMSKDIKSRVWERVSTSQLNLGIKVDYAPTLRLFIEDTANDGNSRGISLDMRMSQFYLIMSIWFANMKELPIVFYGVDLIRESSTDPDPPVDWPEYGSSEFVRRLKGNSNTKTTFEMGICIKKLKITCSFDKSSYFKKIPPSMSMMMEGIQEAANYISLSLGEAICSIKLDEDTLQSIGIGATSIDIHDGRQANERSVLQEICVSNNNNKASFVDLTWGLDCGRHTLIRGIPLPFQVTIYLTPDQHCLINLGMDMAEAALVNLSPIWILLDYFGLYFKEPEYGHPAFEAEQMFKQSMGNNMHVKECDNECLDIDFRMWMIKPHVIIPSEHDLCLMVETAGFYYRYKSFGINYSSQDILAKDLGIVVLKEYMEPSISRGLRQVSGSLLSNDCGAKTLVDGLSFSVRYDCNLSTNYTKFALRVPLTHQHFDRRSMDGIESSSIEASPFIVPPPVVCKPFVTPLRTLGHNETSIYFHLDYLKLALKLLTDFVGPSKADESDVDDSSESIFSVTMDVGKVKLVISDPIMGMHRPILSICFPSLLLTASQLKDIQHTPKSKFEKLTGSKDISFNAKDLQASMEATVFVDYFKLGLTRNWEPFVEPFKCLVLYEKSESRGQGITFNSDCPLHFNITSDLIETIDDALKTFDLFFKSGSVDDKTPVPTKRLSSDPGVVKTVTADTRGGHNLTVIHSPADQVDDSERTAFSLKNTTGEQVRIHTHSAIESDIAKSQTTIMYLDHLQLMPLSFPATETVIKDLQAVEVLCKGDQNKRLSLHQSQLDIATSHDIDLQIPGFQWVRNISFDLTGKHFVQLIPRSLSIQNKIDEDWRMKNVLQMLTEVNSMNGGRRLTITSPFEVINKTNHPIFLATNPDPRHSPDSSKENTKDSTDESSGQQESIDQGDNFTIEKINPDETHTLSYLLLESALHMKGNHLGSLWIRPDQSVSDDFKDAGLDQSTIGYPSRPLQLAKVLHESSVIFKDSGGDPGIANQVASGHEISCPIFDQSKSRSKKPFCYVVEIKRSPFARASTQNDTTGESARDIGDTVSISSPTKKGLKTAKNIFTKNNAPKAEIHAPLRYSLTIHPPLVVENLLPERGLFELMDANSRNVLWWGNLEPGERVSVFTVGLDAPVLLLVNLGFCRTAVGEGALIHHGGGDGIFKAGWTTLGSAMKTSKDKVKKTLGTLTESKDNRGKAKLGMIKTGTMKQNAANTNRKTGQLGFNTENDIIESESSGGGVSRRGLDGYGFEDIATEMNVVDSLGQRLTLLIDNTLGSGGQRRVSLYSPFWIINTTEHALRYKQDKSLSYVAGTVLSAEKDGSKPVDGGERSTIDDEDGGAYISGSNLPFDSMDTIFSGKPGALSQLKRSLNGNKSRPALLAALISEDLPLRALSKLAFMFNFQEEVLSLRGSPRLCIQLADTRSHTGSRYTSAWSSGFGLESIGVTQIVGMHCKDGRKLEASVSISIAPGRLSKYTKIVRICPRYIVVNQLHRPIRLWQDNSVEHPNLAIEHTEYSSKHSSDSVKWIFSTSYHERRTDIINQYELLFGSPTVIEESGMDDQTTAHRDACYIATIQPSDLVAFHLPDTRLERLLRVDYGPSWYLSPSFSADVPGEYVLAMSQARDLRMLPHVSSRGAPFYSVTFPPPNQEDTVWGGELGVWFETEPFRRERTLIVKGIKEGSYASYYTDIFVGDQLMMIDSIPVEQFTFDQAMKYLKTRLIEAKEAAEENQSPGRPLQLRRAKSKKRMQKPINNNMSVPNDVTLTFLTLGERLRRLRRAAVSKKAVKGQQIDTDNVLDSNEVQQQQQEVDDHSDKLLIDQKFLFQSVFVFLRAPDPTDPPHRIINRSLHWKIYYRQRGCDAHPWQCLSPGESSSYTWEEPLKIKKLSIRVGVGEWIADEPGKSNNAIMGGTTIEGKPKSKIPFFSFQFIENEEQGHFGAVKSVKLEEIGYFDKLPCPPRRYKDYDPDGDRTENFLCCQVDTEGATRVLVVSDEMNKTQSMSDEALVRHHLVNIRREIAVEESRRAKIDALNRTVALLANSGGIAPSATMAADSPGAPLSSIDESPMTHKQTNRQAIIAGNLLHHKHDQSSEILSRLSDPEAIESELQHYMDFDDLYIARRNQVVIEVIEATGLRSSDLNGLSNPYVSVGLVCSNKKRHIGSFKSKDRRSTYFVEKTLSPQWVNQAFVFDIPEKAASDPKETRHYSLQCVIKSTERFGKDKFLGQAHVHLRTLKNQKENIGWYPLMEKLGQSRSDGSGKDQLDRICGSIQLRVQWVHDTTGLLEYYILCADRRLETLRRSKDGMKRQLKSLHDAAKEEEERKERSSIMASVPAMTALYKKKRGSMEPAERDSSKEERVNQPTKVIKLGVLATENKLKKTINNVRAARFMAKTKRSTLASSDGRRTTTSTAYSSILDSMLDLDYNMEDDGSSSDEMFDKSTDSLFDKSSDSSALMEGHPYNNKHVQSNKSFKVKSTTAPSSPFTNSNSLLIQSRPDIEITPLSCLRWQSWSHYTNNSRSIPPFYSSWNISHAFINGNNMTRPKRRQIKSSTHSSRVNIKAQEEDTSDLTELLKLPPEAPILIREREFNPVSQLISSRRSFSKAARRSLGSVLNPGGVLTIRPITALNLPESNSMFVKLRYGNTIRLSETVSSVVSPVWNDGDLYLANNGISNSVKSRRHMMSRHSGDEPGAINDWDDIAEIVNPTRAVGIRENDLEIKVLPFETSKSLRISVIGESQRLQSKVELGVLNIPLGAALECCAQSMEDYEEDRNRVNSKGLPPAYVRWFPLRSPSDAIPIEGDMGKNVRPLESEKITDDKFEEYFQPCIKLALMFRPNSDSTQDGEYDAAAGSTSGSSSDQYLYGRLDRISAALIDSSRIIELLSLSSRDVDVRISVSTAKTRLAVAVGNVQVDQQGLGMNTKVPVILSPSPVKHPQPLVQFMAWKDNYRSKSDMDSYEYVAIQVQEMDLKVEESWLYDLFFFYLDVVKKREAKATRLHQDNNIDLASDTFETEVEEHTSTSIERASSFLNESLSKKVKLKKKIYVQELLLGSFKVNLSYFKSQKNSRGSLESSADADFDDQLELFSMYNVQSGQPSSSAAADAYTQWSENMTGDIDERSQYANINIIGAVFPSISEAPIRFTERVISHVYESEGDIWRSLKSFYSAEALRQLYKIVGSLDFAGNPTMVLTSFRTGLKDFFLQPTRELKHITKNPSRVGVGLLKGTLSLVSNSTSGIFGFASSLGATIGHTATILTLDEHYQRLHSEQNAAQQRHYDRWKKKGCGHVTLMISRPVHDIAFGLLSASTGIITEPYRGAKKEGIKGFAKGTAIGVIGVVVKPIVGVSDAFSHVMESVHDIAKSANLLDSKVKPVERYRLPYVFGCRRMLLPFNQVDARSAQLLFAHPLEKKTKKGDEIIIASEALHLGNGIEHYIVVTTMRIALFRLKVVDGQGFVTVNVVWQVRFEKGARITSSLGSRGHSGYILYVSRYNTQKQESNISSLHDTNREESRHGGDYFFAEGDANPDTPKSFYPLGATSSAFRLRSAWPFAGNEGDDVIRFAVEGDFKQRLQLSRIHNAIACMSGDFDSIITEVRHKDKGEGLTSFGPLIFVNQQQDETLGNKIDLSDTFLYSSLERTAWSFNVPNTSPTPSNRNLLDSMPSWLIESRSRGMLIPRHTKKAESDECSIITLPKSVAESYGEDLSANREEDSFMNENSTMIEDNSIYTEQVEEEPHESHSLSMIEESVPANISHSHNQYGMPTLVQSVSTDQGHDELSTGSCLDGRLRRVEVLLETLVSNSPTSNIPTVSSQQSSSHISQYDMTTTAPSHTEDGEQEDTTAHDHVDVMVEALKKEIEDLKLQLAAKKHDETPKPRASSLSVEIPPEEEVNQEIKQQKKKLKGKIKKIFKGKH